MMRHRTMRAVAIGFACLTATLGAAAAAAADSLVFIKSDNVWLANADGTGQYQVTLDGTPGSPYSSPSQADDGTIAALRTSPGGRPQIWRMRQNGGRLNPPINTPAPGTGAIDARISPDGSLVAYWFITQVSTGTCLYCFDLSTRALISHADRFTTPSEVGTPNTGQWPSWMSNNRLILSTGAAEEWYYQLGRPEAVKWWADSDNCGLCTQPSGIRNLSAAEVSRDGLKVAVVRGDSQETIALYHTTGTPPADGSAPPVPTPTCALTGPVGGSFVRPTWSQNGDMLAWQEGDGIWSGVIPFTGCSITPQLIVPGGAQPDFGPAAVNPGARPGCGNPGNPTACQPPQPPQPPKPPKPPISVKALIANFLVSSAGTLRRLTIRGLLRTHRLTVTFTSPGPGVLTMAFTTRGKHALTLTRVRVIFSRAAKASFGLKLGTGALRILRGAQSLRTALIASFTPRGGKTTTGVIGVRIGR